MVANIQSKWKKLVSIIISYMCCGSLPQMLCHVLFTATRCMLISIIVKFVDEDYLKNLMLPILPSSSPCNHQRGLLKITSGANVEQFGSA